jgi:hypothetical protein
MPRSLRLRAASAQLLYLRRRMVMILLVALVPTYCWCAQVSGAAPTTPAPTQASERSADDPSGAVPAVMKVTREGSTPNSCSNKESLRVSWGRGLPKLPLPLPLPLLVQLPHRQRGRCFRWRAALDVETGIASSKESSIVPPTSPLHRRAVPVLRAASAAATTTGEATASSTSVDDSRDTEEAQGREDDSVLLRWVELWAQQYPTWLCSGWVTGGLLRAAVTGPCISSSSGSSSRTKEKKANEPRQGTVEIRTRIGNWHLLTFGPCQLSQRVTYRETLTSVAGGGGNERGHVLTSHCTVVLPVTGGILALPPPASGNGSARKGRGAALLFSVKRQRHVYDGADAATEPAHGRSSRANTGDDSPWRLIQLSSAVAGYRPALAGMSLPVPLWRKTLYLRTQAVLHAYVVWRFHRFGWSGADGGAA